MVIKFEDIEPCMDEIIAHKIDRGFLPQQRSGYSIMRGFIKIKLYDDLEDTTQAKQHDCAVMIIGNDSQLMYMVSLDEIAGLIDE